jgi:hypothetical protein
MAAKAAPIPIGAYFLTPISTKYHFNLSSMTASYFL